MMSAGAKPKVAVTSVVWAAIRACWALFHVSPWPSISKLIVTFGLVWLNLSLIWLIAFLNASALLPEFQAMTLSVTAPPAAVVGAAAAAAVVGAAAAVVGAAAAAVGAAAAVVGAAAAGAVALGAGVVPHAASHGRPSAPSPATLAFRRDRRLTARANWFCMLAVLPLALPWPRPSCRPTFGMVLLLQQGHVRHRTTTPGNVKLGSGQAERVPIFRIPPILGTPAHDNDSVAPHDGQS